MLKKLYIFACFIALLLAAGTARAAESGWVSADQVRGRLISASDTQAAVEIELADGWHSYWRAPGDAGLPPKFDWSESANVKTADISWPYPSRFDEAGLVTFGYTGHNIFPVKITPVKDGDKTVLALTLNIMTCNDICIPQELKMSLPLDKAAAPQAAIIEGAQHYIPQEKGAMTIDTVVAGPDALVITATAPRPLQAADVFAAAGDIAFTAKPEITLDAKDPRKAMIKLPKPAPAEDNLAAFLAGKELNVVLVNGSDLAAKTIHF